MMTGEDSVHQFVWGGCGVVIAFLGGRAAAVTWATDKPAIVSLGTPTREVQYVWDLDEAARLAADEVLR